MKQKLLLVVFIALLRTITTDGQVFSLSDTTITFKNQEGKVLTRDEVKEFMKGVFSLRQQNVDGKKVITIIPDGSDEVGRARAEQQVRIEAFRNGLIGQQLKPFQLTDLSGNRYDLEKLKGKIVVINFWFTGCKPCIQEMPHLNGLVADNKNTVVFLAPAPETETQIRKFLKKYSFDYNISPSAASFITSMNVENFPTHLVVDKEGVIRQVFIGYADDIKEKLQAEIDKLLRNDSK